MARAYLPITRLSGAEREVLRAARVYSRELEAEWALGALRVRVSRMRLAAAASQVAP